MTGQPSYNSRRTPLLLRSPGAFEEPIALRKLALTQINSVISVDTVLTENSPYALRGSLTSKHNQQPARVADTCLTSGGVTWQMYANPEFGLKKPIQI